MYPGLNQSAPVGQINGEEPVHPGQADDHFPAPGCGPAAQPGSRSPGDEGDFLRFNRRTTAAVSSVFPEIQRRGEAPFPVYTHRTRRR